MQARQPDRAERTTPAASGLLAILTLVGLALRLPSFADSLFGDELSAYYIVAGHGLGQVLHLLDYHSTELNPQLFFLLAWLSKTVFGLSSEALKLPSLIFGTATIPLVYALAREATGVATSLLAAALAACSPFLIFYSTEARPYALMLFLVVATALALLRALRRDGWGWWLLYALCTCAAAYTHFTSIFALAAIAAWALVTQPQARRRVLTALALATIGYLPELPVLHKISQSPGTNLYSFLSPLSAHLVRRDLGRWAIGHPFLPLAQVPGTPAAILIAAGAALGLVCGAARLLGRGTDGTGWSGMSSPTALIILLAVASPVGVLLYSLPGNGVWGARNIIASWGAFAVVLAMVVSSPRRAVAIAAAALLTTGFTLGGLSMLSRSVQRPDYENAVAYMRALAPRGAPVADLPGPTPGPPTETEAALGVAGLAHTFPVSRIGYPALQAVIAAPPYAPLPPIPAATTARQVTERAVHGIFFIVIEFAIPPRVLRDVRRRHLQSTAGPFGYLGTFLGDLPARFRLVDYRTFPGLAPVSVYVMRG